MPAVWREALTCTQRPLLAAVPLLKGCPQTKPPAHPSSTVVPLSGLIDVHAPRGVGTKLPPITQQLSCSALPAGQLSRQLYLLCGDE